MKQFNKPQSSSEGSIVQKYSLSLQKDLKTNSLMDIKKLTSIAREEIKYCKSIAKVISTRIKTASAEEKLPSLYLLDSIIKNIGGEYIDEFSTGISDLFFYSFKVQIDLNIQIKYLKLLKTWSTIFGEQSIHDIEERVMKISHYGPKQNFDYEQIKEKYCKQLIYVNPNKFCKSSIDFSNSGRVEGINTTNEPMNDALPTPNLDWLNKILKTSSFVPSPQSAADSNTQQSHTKDNNIGNPMMIHSLYRNTKNITLDEVKQHREWFLSDLEWIKVGCKKRERSIFEVEKNK